MNFFFEIVWICWLLSEILLNRILLAKNNSGKNPDKYSLAIIWITICISIFLGVYFSMKVQLKIINSDYLRISGTLIILLGMLIRFVAIRTLGKFFTVNLNVRSDHKVIQHGFYKYLRHPAYTGSLLSFLGFGLSFNNWLSLLIVFVPVFLSMAYRISIEEKLLLETFGKEYEDYCIKTKRLLPFIF